MSTGADHDSVHRKNDRVLQQASRSDPGDDLDPSLVHRLESLSLLLAISNASDAERNHTRQCRLALWFVGKLDHMLVDHD
jgi:hypothetical protein